MPKSLTSVLQLEQVAVSGRPRDEFRHLASPDAEGDRLSSCTVTSCEVPSGKSAMLPPLPRMLEGMPREDRVRARSKVLSVSFGSRTPSWWRYTGIDPICFTNQVTTGM